MFERVYATLTEAEDSIAERYIGDSKRVIDPKEVLEKALQHVAAWGDGDDVGVILDLIEAADSEIKSGLSTGTENLIQGIADSLEESLYLLSSRDAAESEAVGLYGVDEDDLDDGVEPDLDSGEEFDDEAELPELAPEEDEQSKTMSLQDIMSS